MSGSALSADAVASRLGFAAGTPEHRYVEELGDVRLAGTRLGRLEPFDPVAVGDLCRDLGLSPEDTADVVATLPSPDRAPEWWWCVERAAARLVEHMGDPDSPRGQWPHFEGPGQGLERRCHFFHVALAVVPWTMAYYRALSVPEPIARAALNDVPRHAAIHRRVHGATGVEADWWVSLCLRAEIVNLGRLQYKRHTLGHDGTTSLWYPASEAGVRGPGFRMGDRCLGVHIPEGPPLGPELVGESLELAADFFARYFPADIRRVATCRSWLLDTQLAAYLPQTSNIVSFQHRFEAVPGQEPGDADVLQFVFRAADQSAAGLLRLPQRTTMERVAVAHLRAGRHWYRRTGWLDLGG